MGKNIIVRVSWPKHPGYKKSKKYISGKKFMVHVSCHEYSGYKKTKKMYKWEKIIKNVKNKSGFRDYLWRA